VASHFEKSSKPKTDLDLQPVILPPCLLHYTNKPKTYAIVLSLLKQKKACTSNRLSVALSIAVSSSQIVNYERSTIITLTIECKEQSK
jgi:hypothetical protein